MILRDPRPPPWLTRLLMIGMLVLNLGLTIAALQPLQPVPSTPTFDPIVVQQSSGSLIWLAVINVLSLVLLAMIGRYADSRKDHATAQAALVASAQMAHIKAEEKKLDWQRQDEVARKVAEAATQASTAAKLLVETQIEVVRRQDDVAAQLVVSNAHVDQRLTALDDQGKKIHMLVNSDMTAARSQERTSVKLLVTSLKAMQALNAKNGISSTAEELKCIEDAEARVIELDLIIAERHAAQQAIDAAEWTHRQVDRRKPVPATDAALAAIVTNTAETAKNTDAAVAALRKAQEDPRGPS